MRMQDVITQLRDEVPKLAKHHKETSALYLKVGGLWDDFSRCESITAQGLLMDAAREAMNRFAQACTSRMFPVTRASFSFVVSMVSVNH